MPIAPSTRLPLRCDPILGESLNGFVARLAERNRFDKSDWVANLAGIPYPQVWYSDDALERLAVVTGVEAAALRKMAPTLPVQANGSATATMMGHQVPTEAFVRTGRRACPQCLMQSAHHRLIWDIRFVRSCMEHGRRLLATCPACRRPLDWRTRSIRLCKCGFDLAGAETVAADTNALAGPRLLQAVLLGQEHTLPGLLVGLGFHELFYLLCKFGEFRASGVRFKLDDTVDSDLEGWLTNALETLSQDPAALERTLKMACLRWSPFPVQRAVAVLEEVSSQLDGMGPPAANLAAIVSSALADPRG